MKEEGRGGTEEGGGTWRCVEPAQAASLAAADSMHGVETDHITPFAVDQFVFLLGVSVIWRSQELERIVCQARTQLVSPHGERVTEVGCCFAAFRAVTIQKATRLMKRSAAGGQCSGAERGAKVVDAVNPNQGGCRNSRESAIFTRCLSRNELSLEFLESKVDVSWSHRLVVSRGGLACYGGGAVVKYCGREGARVDI